MGNTAQKWCSNLSEDFIFEGFCEEGQKDGAYGFPGSHGSIPGHMEVLEVALKTIGPHFNKNGRK